MIRTGFRLAVKTTKRPIASFHKSKADTAIIASNEFDLYGLCSVCCHGSTMKHQPQPEVFGPAINRLADVMAHSSRFAFRGSARLAFDAGVSPSSVSRIIHGKLNPSFLMVARLTEALEREFGFSIDPRELIAECGQFPTRFLCDLVGCDLGCLPDNAYDEFGSLKPAFENVKPGEWVTSRYPKGYKSGKEIHA